MYDVDWLYQKHLSDPLPQDCGIILHDNSWEWLSYDWSMASHSFIIEDDGDDWNITCVTIVFSCV